MAGRETDRVYDELLVTLARAGDGRAGERLFVRWHPRLLRTARRIVRDEELARDATQDAWLGMCKGWRKLSDPGKFPAWAFRILHRACADRIGQAIAQRTRTAPLDEAGLDSPAPAARPDDRLDVETALAQLSDDHRIAAALYFGEGLSVAEIAAVTDAPAGTVKSRLFHARKQLKQILEGETV